MSSLFDRFFKGKTTLPTPDSKEAAASVPAPEQFDVVYAEALRAATAKDFERALPLYDQAIELDPARAEPYYKRANALRDIGHLEAALTSYDQAIERKPDYAFAYCNRGVVLHTLGSLDAALSSLDAALGLEPSDAFAHYNRALVLQDRHRWDEALASYDRAIEINPQFAAAQFNRSMVLLFQGDFKKGWPAFEWRWENAQRLSIGAPRNFAEPLWHGKESIAGKRLFLYSEQGLGDTVQFCRYATLCAELGATVILEVQPPLAGALTSLAGVSQLIAKGSPLPPFDYQCPLMSLPLAFNTTVDTIPAHRKYLASDAAKVALWSNRLGMRSRPRIGLVWSGNPNNAIDHRRSIRLADWITHLPSGLQYFCLQKDVREADQAALDSNPAILSYADDLLDFTDTAALCECMDIVVTVDTSVAHLSGALGLPTWLLLAYTPDWRWILGRNDTPWYPSVKLYQQKAAGDWTEVFSRVAADLRREFRR
ncbi:MAG TPA: tetratricopeptide repeat-containing glycosyltransferase family protein [Steroidobacteraceae bacterium]|nr:tetratricopeptide repeat-containing glycosyltransferase family protein [Steroidobacteraceae bacterium]